MAYQLVVTGNRILAYGTDCFYSMGGTVICPDTERVYQNATVVNCDTIPADIDIVGYEYHSGDFVPCAPFGVGDGNIAVVCGNDCKAIKDSGIALKDVAAPKILWENASPSSSFAGQTVILENKDYTFLLIETNEQVFVIKSSGAISRTACESGGTGGGWKVCTYGRSITTKTTIYGTTGLQISDCEGCYVTQNNTYTTTYQANTELVPLRIYGM